MGEEIDKNFENANIEFDIGSGGDFIVEVDDKVIFSKNDLPISRFPDAGEILKLLQQAGY